MKALILRAISVALVCTAPAHAAPEIGTAEEIKANVSTNRSGNIVVNSKVFQNDRVSVNRTGLAHFRFKDGTKMVVGPGANLTLDNTIFNPNGSTFKSFVLKSAAGATRFISGKSASAAFRIETPVGVLGVRGTAFDFRHWRGRTYLMLLDGSLEICARSGTCQQLRRKCDFVIVEPNGSISDPVQPRRSLFAARDFDRYFPFVQDQRPVKRDYRLRINSCQTSSFSSQGGGADGSGAGAGSGNQ